MTEGDIKILSDKVLQTVLGFDAFEKSSVSAGVDDAGDASLFVTAHLKRSAGILSGRKAGDAIVELGHALEDAGEPRFAYLSFEYPEETISEPERESTTK